MVLEANDHGPIFQFEQYTASVAEYDALNGSNVAIGHPLRSVHATDLDMGAGMDETSLIEYYITGGNDGNIFAVDRLVRIIAVIMPR